MGRTFAINGLEKLYIYIYNNSNVTMMFHSNVPKYLNYVIQILACSIETSMSHSNSDTFLKTILEPRKQRRIDFSTRFTKFSSNPVHGFRFQ